ncbi:MAG: hypothetical protein IKV67_06055 [Paludibacteraceae bacterium]|nr:hypothetical protein [Paludibacteraceae bacterium]
MFEEVRVQGRNVLNLNFVKYLSDLPKLSIESGIAYSKFESEEAAKAYYEAAKADGSDASTDGNYVTVKKQRR